MSLYYKEVHYNNVFTYNKNMLRQKYNILSTSNIFRIFCSQDSVERTVYSVSILGLKWGVFNSLLMGNFKTTSITSFDIKETYLKQIEAFASESLENTAELFS